MDPNSNQKYTTAQEIMSNSMNSSRVSEQVTPLHPNVIFQNSNSNESNSNEDNNSFLGNTSVASNEPIQIENPYQNVNRTTPDLINDPDVRETSSDKGIEITNDTQILEETNSSLEDPNHSIHNVHNDNESTQNTQITNNDNLDNFNIDPGEPTQDISTTNIISHTFTEEISNSNDNLFSNDKTTESQDHAHMSNVISNTCNSPDQILDLPEPPDQPKINSFDEHSTSCTHDTTLVNQTLPSTTQPQVTCLKKENRGLVLSSPQGVPLLQINKQQVNAHSTSLDPNNSQTLEFLTKSNLPESKVTQPVDTENDSKTASHPNNLSFPYSYLNGYFDTDPNLPGLENPEDLEDENLPKLTMNDELQLPHDPEFDDDTNFHATTNAMSSNLQTQQNHIHHTHNNNIIKSEHNTLIACMNDNQKFSPPPHLQVNPDNLANILPSVPNEIASSNSSLDNPEIKFPSNYFSSNLTNQSSRYTPEFLSNNNYPKNIILPNNLDPQSQIIQQHQNLQTIQNQVTYHQQLHSNRNSAIFYSQQNHHLHLHPQNQHYLTNKMENPTQNIETRQVQVSNEQQPLNQGNINTACSTNITNSFSNSDKGHHKNNNGGNNFINHTDTCTNNTNNINVNITNNTNPHTHTSDIQKQPLPELPTPSSNLHLHNQIQPEVLVNKDINSNHHHLIENNSNSSTPLLQNINSSEQSSQKHKSSPQIKSHLISGNKTTEKSIINSPNSLHHHNNSHNKINSQVNHNNNSNSKSNSNSLTCRQQNKNLLLSHSSRNPSHPHNTNLHKQPTNSFHHSYKNLSKKEKRQLKKNCDNTYNSVPNMKKSMLVCCQIISIIICFVSWIAAIFSYVTSDWQVASLNDDMISIGLWKVAYFKSDDNYTKYTSYGGWIPFQPQSYLPYSIFLGRILMTSAIALSIVGFCISILGSSLSCCNKSWILACSVQTVTCILLALSTACLGAMAILFPILFKNDEKELKNLPAYKSLTDSENVSEEQLEADRLAFSYGLSLYLCWAAMVLSGVSTAIYTFSTSLLAAEFKLARRKNLMNQRQAALYLSNSESHSESNKMLSEYKKPNQVYSSRTQSAVVVRNTNNNNNNTTTTTEIVRQISHSQSMKNQATQNPNTNNNNNNTNHNHNNQNHTQTLNNTIQTDRLPNKPPLPDGQTRLGGAKSTTTMHTPTPYKYRLGTQMNPQNFPPTLGSSTLPTTRRDFGGYGALVTYTNTKQYDAIRDEIPSDRITGSYKKLNSEERPECETPTRSKKQSVV